MRHAASSSRSIVFVAAVSVAALGLRCADEAAPMPTPEAPAVLASCTYANPFSRSEECKEYIGASWTMPTATTDCTTSRGMFRAGAACVVPAALGRCLINGSAPNATRITFPGDNASQCAITRTGCSVFARGAFTPDGVCATSGDAGAPDASTGDASVPTSATLRAVPRE